VVNEGPLKICEIFLSPNAVDPEGQPYNKQQIEYLKVQMAEFVRMCAFAIRLNKSLISQEHIPFQEMVESKYETLAESVKQYLDAGVLEHK